MSFQQGLSGLNATAKSLEVIGNNIANASTYGAKAARAVADAMPLLGQASQVRILVITEEKPTTQPGAALDLVRHLEAHGVSSVVDEVRQFAKRDRSTMTFVWSARGYRPMK